MPAGTYEYSHPEGTGHETSPFRSCWIVGCPERDEAEALWRWCVEVAVCRCVWLASALRECLCLMEAATAHEAYRAVSWVSSQAECAFLVC